MEKSIFEMMEHKIFESNEGPVAYWISRVSSD